MIYENVDLMSVLLEPFGPGDPAVASTAKFKPEDYRILFKKVKDNSYQLTDNEKEIIMDSFRMFLEGVSDGDVVATTGKDKSHFLNLFERLMKEWNICMPKLKRQIYDTAEYQAKANTSGLVEEI